MKGGALPFATIESSNMQWAPPQGMLLVDVMTLFNESNGTEKQKHNKIIKKKRFLAASVFCMEQN